MKCPFCGHDNTRVIDSRPAEDNNSIRRRRVCDECDKRFTTYEKIETIPLIIIKKDNNRETYDRSKIEAGVLRACHKRPVSAGQLERLVEEVETEIFNMEEKEISTQDIGELVMNKLKDVDAVAYVRFASVYREFKDINTFMDELKKVLDNKCSHEHLEALSGSKAGSKTTIQKLYDVTVNIAEDQKQPKYINNSMLTRVISGEPILEKGMDKPVKPHATLLFSMNEVVNFRETSLAITDRFVVIPFTVTFTDEKGNRNINIEDELCEDKALQVIVTRSVQAFEKVLDTGKFTIPEKVKKATDDYFMECNTVAEFCTLVPIKTFIHKSR